MPLAEETHVHQGHECLVQGILVVGLALGADVGQPAEQNPLVAQCRLHQLTAAALLKQSGRLGELHTKK